MHSSLIEFGANNLTRSSFIFNISGDVVTDVFVVRASHARWRDEVKLQLPGAVVTFLQFVKAFKIVLYSSSAHSEKMLLYICGSVAVRML